MSALVENVKNGLASRGFDSRAGGAADFADLEAHKTAHRDILAQLGDGLVDHLFDGDRLVADVMLFVEAIFLVELFHFSGDDFLHYLLGFSGRARLLAVNVALFFQHLRRDFFAPQIAWIECGDVHGDVVAQLLKGFRARHEIRFAVYFHNHADFSAGVNVVAHQPLAGFALGLFRGGGLALFPQNVDGLLHVAGGFHQRRAAIAEAGAGALAQFLHEICRYLRGLRLCAHPFVFLAVANLSVAFDAPVCKTTRRLGWSRAPGPLKSLPARCAYL